MKETKSNVEETSKSYVWIAVVVILTVLLACCCFALVYPILDSVGVPSDSISFYLAYINFWADVLTGLLAIIAFVWAGRQFLWEREQYLDSQEIPALDLQISEKLLPEKDTREITFTSLQIKNTPSVKISLKNTGTGIGLWYQVTFSIPSDFINNRNPDTSEFIKGTWLHPADGSKEHRHIYQSNGMVGVYPGSPITLCSFPLQYNPDCAYQSRYEIPYTIVTNKPDRKRRRERKPRFLVINVIQDYS